jgi:hypothetical protein
MRKLTFILLNIFFASGAMAQDEESDISKDFKTLQVNSSPAYVVLGVEPENIQRPNSPAEFVANVQSATVNNTLATNFAMETSPYFWGKNKPGSDRFDVVSYIASDDYLQNMLRSLTFSFATSPSDNVTFGTLPAGTALGLGAHVQLISGKLSPKTRTNLLGWFYDSRAKVLFESLINDLEDDEEISDLEDWVDTQIANESALKDLPDSQKDAIKSLFLKKIGRNAVAPKDLKSVQLARDVVARKAKSQIGNVNKYKFPLTREGFMLEFSWATAKIASDAEWSDMTTAKTALWLTPSYRFNVNEDPAIIDMIDIMAVARWTDNDDAVDESDYLDAGGKLQWIHERISLSYEAIYRYGTKKPDDVKKKYTYRTGLTFSYKLNELVTFKTTFGQKFNGTSTEYDDPRKMFLVGGFNFGFSKLGKTPE